MENKSKKGVNGGRQTRMKERETQRDRNRQTDRQTGR